MALDALLGLIHFPIMVSALIFLGISIVVIIIHKPKMWFRLHILTSAVGIILAIIGVLTLNALLLDIPHGVIGLIILILLIIELAVGFFARKTKDKRIRLLHIWVSRTIYIVALITAILGLINFL